MPQLRVERLRPLVYLHDDVVEGVEVGVAEVHPDGADGEPEPPRALPDDDGRLEAVDDQRRQVATRAAIAAAGAAGRLDGGGTGTDHLLRQGVITTRTMVVEWKICQIVVIIKTFLLLPFGRFLFDCHYLT